MAVDGVACTGCSGEDSAVPGRNALVLETNDLQEFLRLFGALHTQARWERALRRTARSMARHYAWPQIIRHLLLPRLDSPETYGHVGPAGAFAQEYTVIPNALFDKKLYGHEKASQGRPPASDCTVK